MLLIVWSACAMCSYHSSSSLSLIERNIVAAAASYTDWNCRNNVVSSSEVKSNENYFICENPPVDMCTRAEQYIESTNTENKETMSNSFEKNA